MIATETGFTDVSFVRAQAGLDLQGPYCFLNDHFSVPDDHKPTFELLPGDFTNFHNILHTASRDSPDKKLLKDFHLPNNTKI